MKTFGELIKEFRERENWPQRKLANELDIDVAVLSRIENENKFPKKRVNELIKTLSRLFDISENELKHSYLSDVIVSIIRNENDYKVILKVSEEKIYYARNQNIVQSQIKFNNGSN